MAPDYPVRRISHANLYRPQHAADTIARPRLLKLLHAFAPLTLVIAPAGYGKTTVLADWLGEQSCRSTWLTLDSELNDMHLFLAHLIAAMREVAPVFAGELAAHLESFALPPGDVVAEMLCRAFEDVGQDFVLVLDDYHAIRNPQIHAILTEVLNYFPPNLHLAIAARHDPPLPVARLRAHMRVVELRSRELSFNELETRQLMESSLSLSLSEHEIDDLVRGTEGWGVSLQLARLYFRQEQGFASLSQALEMGARQAMEFLSEEVFALLPDAMQEFLMQTAILERLCVRACVAVSGGTLSVADAHASLNWLASNGVFTSPVDDTEECFQYHAVLRQLALQQMQRRYTGEQIAVLHQRVGVWCAEQGDMADAIRHMLAAGNEHGALRLFAEVRPSLMNAEDWPLLGQLLRLFPQHMAAGQLELLVAQAWIAQNQFDRPKVQALLGAALPKLKALKREPELDPVSAQDTLESLEGELEILQTFLAYWAGDLAGVMVHGRRALALTSVRLWSVRMVALSQLLSERVAVGDLAAVHALLDETAKTIESEGVIAQLRLLSVRGLVPLVLGDLVSLSELADQLLAMGSRAPWTDRSSLTYLFKAVVHYHRNELELVEPVLVALVPRRYQSLPQIYVHTMAVLVLALQALNRPDAANETADATLAYAEQLGKEELIAICRALKGELALRQGRLNDAALHLREWVAVPLTPSPFFFCPHITLARLYVLQNTPESLTMAGELLDRLEHLWRALGYPVMLMETLALRTQFWLARAEQANALDALERALRLAEPSGYIRIFADLGSAIDPVLAKLQEQGVAPLLIAAIRTALASESYQPMRRAAPASDKLTVLLTFREQEVLRLISEHLSNQEIAAVLCISVDTVKRHNISIFRKLQVNNRRAAALYARQLPPAYAGRA